ncbi:protein FAM81B [Salmo trutta]|uniref:Family with sequence similarity 81 member B n=1 Tax=Salmo trutta TaxID=8032 RepID=A0A673WIW2_SALTR|nr:protein FAM81B [Salmo trutta]XP_029618025.1 protein FAM81B [Salmo trutta]
MSHESMLQPYQPYDKSDVIEGRLTNQERTMSVLLEQALRIKEEVVASLHFTQGSVQSETSSRRLLESHIHTITHIVKQLSTDIQVLKSQIAQRDSITSGTSFAMQSLDHKNLAGFGDLRGRVARCDASIAKLSGDVSDRAHEIARLQQELSEVKSGLGERLREIDIKLSQAVSRLEVLLVEQTHGQRNSWTDLHSQIKLLEAKSSGVVREAREDTDRLRMWTEQQLSSSAQTHRHGSEVLRSLLQDKMVEADGRLSEQIRLLSVRVERAEIQLEQEHQENRVKHSKSKLHSRINTLETSLREELQLIKQDYQSGFQSIHDAIDSLRQIGDTKARLDKEKLQKDIKEIRRKMVELRDV